MNGESGSSGLKFKLFYAHVSCFPFIASGFVISTNNP